MAIDMFTTRFLLDALKQMHPPKTFLRDTFFKNVKRPGTVNIDVDIQKGKRKLASYINPLLEAEFVERAGYETKSVKLPYIREIMRTGAEDLLQRAPGFNLYDVSSSPAMRAAQQLGDDLAELQNRIIRRIEWNAAQVLDTGKVSIVGKGVNFSLDFGMDDADHVVDADTMWDQVGADPLEDLSAWIKLVKTDSGLVPDYCIMGSDAMAAFINDTKIQSLLDKRMVDVGTIAPKTLSDGVGFVGSLKYPGAMIDIYTYDEIYEDENGDKQDFVPAKHVWIGSSRAYTSMFYGPIYNLDVAKELGTPSGLIDGVEFLPSTWTVRNPSARNLMVESSPLCAMHQCDAFLSATVLS